MEIKKNINNDSEIICPVLYQQDQTGKVYIAKDKVYREITGPYQRDANDLLNSSFFQELIDKKLFPKTFINRTAQKSDKFVLEHERAPFITQSWEWSFSMLRDAALVILNIAKISEKYGYGLFDSHIYNTVFFSSTPMFVDFGSLRRKVKKNLPRKEFLRNSFLPLKLWSTGNFYIANRLLVDQQKTCRLLPCGDTSDVPIFHDYYKSFRGKSRGVYWVKMAFNMLLWRTMKYRLFDVSNYHKVDFTLDEIENKIKKIPRPKEQTKWRDYHDKHFNSNKIKERFVRILDVVSKYKWKTAVDVAGNGGYFSEILSERFNEAKILCIDYDSQALEGQYNRICQYDKLKNNISLGMINIMYPESSILKFDYRARADILFALAITHHLILSQHADIDVIFNSFSKMTRNYLAIEFMPLGLWDGKKAPPIPEWYTESWFKAKLNVYFEILEKKSVDHRVFFFCRKKKSRDI